MGNGAVLTPDEFQRISAGTGISHSEFNPSRTESTHFYQIWLLPKSHGIQPSYEQKRFDDAELRNALRVVASPDGQNGSLLIHQEARIFLGNLDTEHTVTHSLPGGRHAWLQVLHGSVTLNGQPLDTSDGAAISDESQLTITAISLAEIMLFDLA